MTQARYYLRQDVMMEPLVNRWYAYWQLVAPSNAAMVIANSHLRIMRSFVTQPQAHAEALKNPAMIGSPFLNVEPARAAEVAALIERTERDSAPLLRMAEAIKHLARLLSADTAGTGLERLYGQVPEALRGYVELDYDLQHRASFRFIEPLLYRSPFYEEGLQSVCLGSLSSDARPFMFSTPRLPSPEQLHLPLPFRHPLVDHLSRMRTTPGSLDPLRELAGEALTDAVVERLFTTTPPPPSPRFEGEGVRVRYFGHASLLIESRRASVLTDPGVSYRYPTALPRYTFGDLPERIDYVVITHAHADHFSLESLLQLRSRVGQIVVPKSNGRGYLDPSLKLILQRTGFQNVLELEELDSLPLPGGEILALPFLGEHADLDIRSKLAFLVRLEGRTVIGAADSNAVEPRLYELIASEVGALDALYLGMESEGAPMNWAYGALFPTPLGRQMTQARRLNGANCQTGMALIDRLRPKRVFNYAMGLEPWLSHVMGLEVRPDAPQMLQSDQLLARCKDRGIEAHRLNGQHQLVL